MLLHPYAAHTCVDRLATLESDSVKLSNYGVRLQVIAEVRTHANQPHFTPLSARGTARGPLSD